MIQKIKENAKALLAFLTSLNTGMGTALIDERLTLVEGVTVGIGVLIATVTVWASTNSPSAAQLEALAEFKNS